MISLSVYIICVSLFILCFMCLFLSYLTIHIYISVYYYYYLPIYRSVHLSTYLAILLSVYRIYMAIYLKIYLSIHLSGIVQYFPHILNDGWNSLTSFHIQKTTNTSFFWHFTSKGPPTATAEIGFRYRLCPQSLQWQGNIECLPETLGNTTHPRSHPISWHG